MKIDRKVEYFVFTGLSYGLKSARFLFTQIVRPLEKYWIK